MKMKFLVVVALVIGLSGCAPKLSPVTHGTELTPALEQSFIIGTTTKDEVKAKMGYPEEITNDEGRTQYEYLYVYSTPQHSGLDERIYIFDFAEDGTLKEIIKRILSERKS